MEMEIDDATPALEEESFYWNRTYIWRVENWTRSVESKIYSPEFEIGGYSWKLLIYPRGNQAIIYDHYISVYLIFSEASYTPPEMCPKAKFQIEPMVSIITQDTRRSRATHTFTAQSHGWGFPAFLLIQEVLNSQNSYLVDDTLTLSVEICLKNDGTLGMISNAETGFVGVKSSGETSLLSTFLQCLFHIKVFRGAVYQMPTLASDDPQKSIPLALLHLFYTVQYQNTSAKIKDLIEALDWDCADMRLQHDVLEMQRTLFEKLGEDDKAESARDCISRLFTGEYSNNIKSPGLQETQRCKQAYMEIPLDILECKDIYASLEKFCQIEGLEKDNHYRTTVQRLHESKHYKLFDSFPTVILFHLKRFYYNPERAAFLKINTPYEFYDELDLDYNGRVLLSEDADRTIEHKYKLYSVTVQEDCIGERGHSSFLRHHEKWYKFAKETVKEVSSAEAINGQLGDRNGVASANFSQRFESIHKSAAVRLVYIRMSEWERVMCDATQKHLPKQVRASFEKERRAKEKQQREKRNAHLFVNIRLAAECHFIDQIGERDKFDVASFDNVKNYRIHKTTPFESFKKMVKKDFGIRKHLQRFWQWSIERNDSMRVSGPFLERTNHLKTVLDLRQFKVNDPPSEFDKIGLMTVNIFLESSQASHPRRGCILRTIQEHELMIFLKYYDPEWMTLSYLAHIFLQDTSSFRSILKRSKKMVGLSPEDKVIGIKEDMNLRHAMWPDLLPEKTPKEYSMLHGDIIIIQKLDVNSQLKHPTAKSFLEYMHNATIVSFKPWRNPTKEGFKLELLKTITYEQVTNEVGNHLKVADPKKLRLTRHNINIHKPYWSHIVYNGIESLEEMLLFRSQPTRILYYEVLDFQLPYLETHRRLRIEFYNAKLKWQSRHRLMLPKSKKVSDLVKALKVVLGEDYNDCDLRVMREFSSKSYEVLDPKSFLKQLQDSYGIFKAEVIPEDQKNLKSNEFLVLFFQCELEDDYVEAFRNPLWIKVKKGETVRDVKGRIQEILEISNKAFHTWRIAFRAHPMHPVEYLRDKDEILARFPNVVMSGSKNGKFVGDDVSFIALVH